MIVVSDVVTLCTAEIKKAYERWNANGQPGTDTPVGASCMAAVVANAKVIYAVMYPVAEQSTEAWEAHLSAMFREYGQIN